MPEDGKASEAAAFFGRFIEGVHRRQAVGQQVGDGYGQQAAVEAELVEARKGQVTHQERGKLVAAGRKHIAVGVALNNGYGLATAIAFALAIGALAGAFNGLLVVGLRIPAIVATLGTLGLYRGVMLLWTGGKWIEGLPDSLKSLSEPAFIGVSPLGWLVLALLLAGGWLLSRTASGRDFYAVGDNLAAARQLGVAVNRTRMLAFTLNGMLAACAGIVFAAQIGFVPNQTGSGLEMKAIAACVLGGISLLGGTGTLLGAFLGAFFLTQIDTVLVLFRLPAWWNDFIAGLVLLGVLVLDGRLRQALARHQRALKYSRFQPGNKGGKQVARFPERKSKEVA